MHVQVVNAASDLRRELIRSKAPAEAREPFLGLVAKVIKINPDYYTMWNYRKEAALLILPDKAPEPGSSSATQAEVVDHRTQSLEAAIAMAIPYTDAVPSSSTADTVQGDKSQQQQTPALTQAQIVQRELALTVEAFKR